MARSSQAVSLLAAALCIFSILGLADCHEEQLSVEGKVYCDTCRVQFETSLSKYLPGSKVRLECKDRASGELKYSIEGTCDSAGKYKILVEGDHEEEICEVLLLRSSNSDCSERDSSRDRARIALTKGTGIASSVRLANPLGFMQTVAHNDCPDVLKKLGFLPTGGLA